MITVYCDGLCEPVNPGGISTAGFVVYGAGRKELHREAEIVRLGGPDSTNNLAEYTAIIHSMEWLLNNGYQQNNIIVSSDSLLAIKQLQGAYKVNAMKNLHQEAKRIAGMFPSIRFEWVPREHNIVADDLTRDAYRRALGQIKDAGGVVRAGNVYWVLSSKGDQLYEVNPDKHTCTCLDHARRKRDLQTYQTNSRVR